MIPDNLFERNNQEFSILLDTESFENELGKSSEAAKRIIRFSYSHYFKMMRTPYEVTDQDLKQITTYELVLDKEKRYLRINHSKDSCSITAFSYREKDITQVASQLYGKDKVTKNELETIRLVFIQAVLDMDKTQNCIFVTEKGILLENRIWFETVFPGKKLNIVSVNEAVEIMDLFLKFNQNYSAGPNSSYGERLWYWAAFRYLVPHFNISSRWINALSDRFVYLLMSLDKMGFEYYSGVSNATQVHLVQYFNHYVPLVTGIMDNLALESKGKYSLAFKGDHIPSRISLRNKAGKEFLKSLGQRDKPLREHIRAHSELINVIYELREAIIHRDMLESSVFQYSGKDGNKWKSSFVKIDKSLWDIINRLSDSNGLDPFSRWGKYQHNGSYFLEPFTFCKEYLRRLIPFVDSFLEHLRYPDHISDLRQKTPQASLLEIVDRLSENSLMYY